MNKYIYEIDEQGFIAERYIGTFDVNGNLISHEGNYITTDLPQPLMFYKPKFDGVEWIEGETEEEKAERESQQLLDSLKPTTSEITDAELEIKMITMLTEMGVIQ